jgi:cytochrome c-type biogenesis protein CcmH
MNSRFTSAPLPMWITGCLLLLACFAPFAVEAKIEAHSFENPQQEATYNKLVNELRCLVCQNQNLADSNAELAQDMRRKTYKMVVDGKNEKEIVDFMVSRYGDFVMYRPPLKSTTFLLWFGPLVLIIIAVMIVIVFMQKQKPRATEAVSEQQQQRAHSLLDED